MRKIVLVIVTLLSVSSFAQDTLSIMYYNLLKYPNINPSRISHLQEILPHVKPDIFVVNELSSAAGAADILNNALNINGVTSYAAATYVNGPDDENMLYYNSTKLGLVDENVIPTSLRDINEYVLYYKDPALTASSDTAYLYIYGLHLKASQGSEAQRDAEASVLKSYLAIRSNPENTIVGGDFNIYNSGEPAYGKLTFSNQANLHDPLGSGNWHNNSAFAPIFTQSTRTTTFDGGSIGGMDDRFDMMLFSDDMLTGSAGVKYIDGSYTAIGQDGLRFNGSLISPINTSEPSNIIDALYYMSDHLPILMKMAVGGDLSVEDNVLNQIKIYPNPAHSYVKVVSEKNQAIDQIRIIDLQGRDVLTLSSLSSEVQIDISALSRGNYFMEVTSGSGRLIEKISIN